MMMVFFYTCFITFFLFCNLASASEDAFNEAAVILKKCSIKNVTKQATGDESDKENSNIEALKKSVHTLQRGIEGVTETYGYNVKALNILKGRVQILLGLLDEVDEEVWKIIGNLLLEMQKSGEQSHWGSWFQSWGGKWSFQDTWGQGIVSALLYPAKLLMTTAPGCNRDLVVFYLQSYAALLQNPQSQVFVRQFVTLRQEADEAEGIFVLEDSNSSALNNPLSGLNPKENNLAKLILAENSSEYSQGRGLELACLGETYCAFPYWAGINLYNSGKHPEGLELVKVASAGGMIESISFLSTRTPKKDWMKYMPMTKPTPKLDVDLEILVVDTVYREVFKIDF